jgi:hypothetical protein
MCLTGKVNPNPVTGEVESAGWSTESGTGDRDRGRDREGERDQNSCRGQDL